MPVWILHNPNDSVVILPSPLQGQIQPRRSLRLDTQAVNMDTPAMQVMIRKGLINANRVEESSTSNRIEIPVLDLVGTGGGLVLAGDWLVGTPYSAGVVVRYGGQSWVALLPSTGQEPILGNPFWQPLSESVVWRGDWLVGTEYHTYDLVRNGGQSWVALQENIGVTPVEGLTWASIGGTGGGLTPVSHDLLDTLVHDLAETHEVIPTITADGIITTLTAQGLGGGTLIRDVDQMTVDSDGLITGYRVQQRDGVGTVVQTITGAVTVIASLPTKGVVTRT